jgi:GR25 family glycosyltransferase involved in LPS biosynthesis
VGWPKDSLASRVVRRSAVEGRALVWNDELEAQFYYDEKTPFRPKRFFGPHQYAGPVIGCALTHMKIWLDMESGKLPDLVWVNEDDPIPAPRALIRIYPILCYLLNHKSDWDFCYMSAVDMQNIYPKEDIFVHDNIQWLRKPDRYHGSGTASYIIQRSGAVKLLNHLRKNRCQQPIDHEMINCFDNCRAYIARPLVMIHPGDDTDIQGATDSRIRPVGYQRKSDTLPTW